MADQELTWQATAAADILGARKKNGRIGSRKTRSGCITCKIRRVKCDEAKPECLRCKSTGRKCDGYLVVPTKAKSGHSLIGSQLSNSIGLADGDRRAFDYFLSWSAPRLAGSLDKDFWCGYVLQLAQVEPLVRDSLLAISILYEHPQYMTSFHSTPGDDSLLPRVQARSAGGNSPASEQRIDLHHMRALRHYNSALSAFRKLVDDGKATPSMSLLSSILFMCIETIRDNVFVAISLFNKGMEILKQFPHSAEGESEQRLLNFIKLMYARLSVLTATSALELPYKLEVPPESVISGQRTVFANLAEARASLFDLMADSHAYIRQADAWKQSLIIDNQDDQVQGYFRLSFFGSVSINSQQGVRLRSVSDAMSETRSAVLPATINPRTYDILTTEGEEYNNTDDLADMFERTDIASNSSQSPYHHSDPHSISNLAQQETAIQNRLGQWLDAFQWPRKQAEETDPEVVSYLLMYYHISAIWLNTRLNATQTIFDDFTFHFREIVRHADVYVKAKAIQNPSYTFEVGAVPPLYFVTTKCRIPSLRRHALDLLTIAPKKEFLWGARSTAELACRLIAVEEEGLGLPIPTCDGRSASLSVDDVVLPPEQQRVHDLEILRNDSTNSFDVRATRYIPIEGRLLRTVQDFPI